MTALTGTGALLRLALRRDRIMLAAWILVFVVSAAGSAAATIDLYPDEQARVSAAVTTNSTPTLVALYGWVFDTHSLGAISLFKLTAFGSALVALFALLLVTRHTRAEEEAGRLELVGAAVVGRHAALAAAVLVAAGASVTLGLVTAVALIGVGLPAAGSFAFGSAWAALGIAFAGVAAVAAQLTTAARAANGIAAGVLGVAYLVRAVGDSAGTDGPTALSWFSPIGWAQQVRPYAGDRWWVLSLLIVFAVVTVAGAFALVARRDHGAGLLPDRPGPAGAAPALAGPLALAWRLHRGTVLGWTVAFALLGGVLGGMAGNVSGFLDSPRAKEFITRLGGQQGITDAFLAAEMSFIGVFVSAFGVQVAMRMRTEETSLRAEPLLATATSRLRFAMGHLAVALAGAVLLLTVAGLSAGLVHGASSDMGQLPRVLGAALVNLPAVLVLTGVVVAAFGLLPRFATAGWVALTAFVLLGQLGPILRLDQWVMDLSPFTHTPRLPGPALSVAPLLWLTAVAVLLFGVGLTAFRRRDITS